MQRQQIKIDPDKIRPLEEQLIKGYPQLIHIPVLNKVVRFAAMSDIIVKNVAWTADESSNGHRQNRLVNFYKYLDDFIFSSVRIYTNGVTIDGYKTSIIGRYMSYKFFVGQDKILDPCLLTSFRQLAAEYGKPWLYGCNSGNAWNWDWDIEHVKTVFDMVVELFADIFHEHMLTARKRGRPRKYPLMYN